MRGWLIALGLAAVLAGPARADAPTEQELLDLLQAAPSPEAAKAAEGALREVWANSGSDSADFLFLRAHEALAKQDLVAARTLLDALLDLAPDFAEAWNTRATLNYVEKRYEEALGDLRRTLEINPEHFGAYAGLGTILEEYGDKQGALTAFRRALSLNPHLDGLAERVRALEPEVEGRGI